jgi:AcrR family transcriptional regulator
MTTTPPPATTRSTAAARREHLLEVAMVEFASRGYEGGSTERIAKAAGISQPYVFRLFGSKLQLFLATIERCLDETLEMFVDAAAGLDGEAALVAIGEAYGEAIVTNPTRLQVQLVGYAACDEPEVRAAMRLGFGRLVEYAERVSGAGPERVARFFAKGMLLNVVTAMQLPTDPIGWGDRLIDGCTLGTDEGAGST